jgi:hypothetical protein
VCLITTSEFRVNSGDQLGLKGFLGEIGAGSNSACVSAVFGALCSMQVSPPTDVHVLSPLNNMISKLVVCGLVHLGGLQAHGGHRL